MQSAPIPENELDRLRKLKLYQVLDTPPEEEFDRIVRIVAETIDIPIALVSLVDSERQWFKAKYGLEAQETSRDVAFCAHTILGEGVLIVEDATKDSRFAENPLVTGDPSIRFYAGAPLRTPDGKNLGTLCAIDRKPRSLSEKQIQLLSDLSRVVVDELELRVALRGAMLQIAEEVRERLLKEDFVSTISHELRTPLTSIRGSLGLLDGGAIPGMPKAATDIIAIANRNVNTLLELVNDLLDIQKFESGAVDFDFRAIDTGTLVRESCENMDGFAQERDVRVLCEIKSAPTITGDGCRLSQVLANLISNAIKFSPQGGEVIVRTDLINNKFRICVEDQGPGIPEEFQGRIFDKFSQASGRNKVKGSGLGLAISKAIVEGHRGGICFDTREGKGTSFFVELPVKQTVLS